MITAKIGVMQQKPRNTREGTKPPEARREAWNCLWREPTTPTSLSQTSSLGHVRPSLPGVSATDCSAHSYSSPRTTCHGPFHTPFSLLVPEPGENTETQTAGPKPEPAALWPALPFPVHGVAVRWLLTKVRGKAKVRAAIPKGTHTSLLNRLVSERMSSSSIPSGLDIRSASSEFPI